MKKQSQIKQIFRALLDGRTLTALDAFKLCGSMNLSTKVSQLKNKIWLTGFRVSTICQEKRAVYSGQLLNHYWLSKRLTKKEIKELNELFNEMR